MQIIYYNYIIIYVCMYFLLIWSFPQSPLCGISLPDVCILCGCWVMQGVPSWCRREVKEKRVKGICDRYGIIFEGKKAQHLPLTAVEEKKMLVTVYFSSIISVNVLLFLLTHHSCLQIQGISWIQTWRSCIFSVYDEMVVLKCTLRSTGLIIFYFWREL